jgi:hypothetical protein
MLQLWFCGVNTAAKRGKNFKPPFVLLSRPHLLVCSIHLFVVIFSKILRVFSVF